MHASRRDFLHLTLAAGACLAAGGAMARPVVRARSKRILILGGTGFLGPAVVEAAKSRGHSLTLFNRGRTEKRIGIIDGVEKRYGNRDPEKHAEEGDPTTPKGLAELREGEWDAVVDTSGYVPRIVSASATLLAPRVGQYIFVSSVSVYKSTSTPGDNEFAELATMPDPTDENVQQHYGALKALCGIAAENAMPGRVADVRPGLIVGPGDQNDRFTYWPVRVSRGGEVLAPGTPDDPIQLIDVRDLAEFIVQLIETGTTGPFDALGPARGLTMGKVLEACRGASGSDARFTWAPAEFLREKNVRPWADMPVWVPPEGGYAGFHRRDVARAVGAGMKFRPIEETCAATLAWWPGELERRARVTRELIEAAERENRPRPTMADPSKLRAGIEPEREAEVLAALKGVGAGVP